MYGPKTDRKGCTKRMDESDVTTRQTASDSLLCMTSPMLIAVRMMHVGKPDIRAGRINFNLWSGPTSASIILIFLPATYSGPPSRLLVHLMCRNGSWHKSTNHRRQAGDARNLRARGCHLRNELHYITHDTVHANSGLFLQNNDRFPKMNKSCQLQASHNFALENHSSTIPIQTQTSTISHKLRSLPVQKSAR